MTYVTRPTYYAPGGTIVEPFEGWAVLPHPDEVRMGLCPDPLFTTTHGHGSAFFDAQNAKIILSRVTGRRLHIDLIETYEGIT